MINKIINYYDIFESDSPLFIISVNFTIKLYRTIATQNLTCRVLLNVEFK